jgi:hypothetical protein
MMVNLSSAPPAVRALVERMTVGGALMGQENFDSPVNQRFQLATPRGALRVVADRGQWFVELAPEGSEEFFDSAVWVSCLTGSVVSVELPPLESQVAWFIEFLGDENGKSVALKCLLRARRRRALARMGIVE